MLSCCSLLDLEAKIEQGLQGFYEAGKALLEIRERRLYQAEHATFEAYCQKRWGMNRAHAYRLMTASQTIEALPGEKPESEWQTRPLNALPPDQQAAAWSAAQAIAGPQPSAATVERSVKAVKAALAWQPGARVQAVDSGAVLTVERVDGVIVHAKTEEGESLPFFSNELQSEAASGEVLTQKVWTAQVTKSDRLEALEVDLQVARLRIEILEQMLSRVITMAGPWINPELIAEAQALLS